MQLARCLLLQPTGNERCHRVALLFAPFNRLDDECLALNLADDATGLFGIFNRGLAAVDTMEFRFKRRWIGTGQQRGNRPVLFAAKGLPLRFTLTNQSHRHRLHSAHTETASHLVPEQLAALVTNDTVQNTSGLLRIDKVHIYFTRRLQRAFDRRLGDLVEQHSEDLSLLLFLLRLSEQLLLKMPRDGLPFAIRVRGQKHLVCLFRFLLDLRQHFRLALDRDVLRLKIVLEIHAQLTGRQVFDMSDRRHDRITAAQIFRNRPRLGRRLNDNQIFCHSNPVSASRTVSDVPNIEDSCN